jgi:hypothetical protein
MASILQIAAGTAAATSATSFTLGSGDTVSVFSSVPLKNGEKVLLERSYDAGATWVGVTDPGFGGVVLNAGTQTQNVNGPGLFRLAKSYTVTATAVYIDA